MSNFFGIEQYFDDEEIDDLRAGLKTHNISLYDFMSTIAQRTCDFTEKTMWLPSEKDMRRIIEGSYLTLKNK